MRIRIVVVLCITIVIVVIAGLVYVYHRAVVEPGDRMGRDVVQLRMRLLCETDHHVLLEACRELSRLHMSGKLDLTKPLESSAQLPEVIRMLRPRHVAVRRDGIVKIEMYTGWSPLGVWAFPKGYEKPSVGYGDRKLIEGLWYYDDGYSFHPDEYDKVIGEILEKCGKLKSPERTDSSGGKDKGLP